MPNLTHNFPPGQLFTWWPQHCKMTCRQPVLPKLMPIPCCQLSIMRAVSTPWSNCASCHPKPM